MKVYLLFIIFLLIINCSFNKKTQIWNYNESDNSINILSVSDSDLEFDIYKKSILNYSKKANYPDIN